jgi:hypothetical protein
MDKQATDRVNVAITAGRNIGSNYGGDGVRAMSDREWADLQICVRALDTHLESVYFQGTGHAPNAGTQWGAEESCCIIGSALRGNIGALKVTVKGLALAFEQDCIAVTVSEESQTDFVG